jgi:radical SAM family uncharacterized protein/radical SAM-linked protein
MNNIKKYLNVSKPLRYVNHELNKENKNIDGLLSICLIYPDLYEIGMSNYGLQLIYNEINKSDFIFADRFYMPGLDAIEHFGVDIFRSLEYQKDLRSFDLIAFSLQCELTYTNILGILDKSGIGIRSEYRTSLPIVVAGGSGAYNPEPLREFVDVFFIGEMELKFREVCEKLFSLKIKRKEDILNHLNEYDFCYVPSMNISKKVKRHINMDFSYRKNPDGPLVPLFDITHDRLVIESIRGCTNGCRFCQAGYIYRPLREKHIEDLIEETQSKLRNTGYLNCSFLALSLSDYTALDKLISFISKISVETSTAVSVPSLRADLLNTVLLDNIAFIKKGGFTIAAEAGSESLRKSINKNITNNDLIFLVEEAAKKGYDNVKIYFMIGLPNESNEDIESIVDLSVELRRRGRIYNKNFKLTISVSNFVPKPFTPFQWCKQADRDYIIKTQDKLKKLLTKEHINVKFHNSDQSIIEGIISRGNKMIGDVIEKAYYSGCLLDEWKEYFNFHKWENAFAKIGCDYSDCLNREFSLNDELPWDFIDMGVTKNFLIEEYNKSLNLINTNNCIKGKCNNCGVCDFNKVKNILSITDSSIKTNPCKKTAHQKLIYMINFSKTYIALLLSALDITRLFSMILRSLGVDFVFSKGFHKLPKINYLYPLPLGIEGKNELIVMEVENVIDVEVIKRAFNNKNNCGLRINDIFAINSTKFNGAIAEYILDENFYAVFIRLLESNKGYYEKYNKKGQLKVVNIKDYLIEHSNNRVSVAINNSGTVNFIDFFKYWNYYNINYTITRDLVKIQC